MVEIVCFPFCTDIPVGGGHPSSMLLMQSLAVQQVRPILALHGEDGPAGRWLREHGANFEQVHFQGYAGGSPRKPVRDLSYIARESWALARFLKDKGVSIVHANDIWMMGTWALAAKIARVKLIWHHRSNARFQVAHRIAFRAADRMIAVSPYAAGSRASHRKSVIIGDPFVVDVGNVDRERVRRRLLGELGLAEPVQVLGFFANLKASWSARKRPLVLVEALARLNARAPERRFVAAFYGEVTDDFRAAIEARARALGVDRQVFLMGFRHDVNAELTAVDVVVAPAVAEGFGRVPVEAMMLGTPVIASDSGNHPSLVRDNETGGLFRADDASALAEKVLWMTEDEAARRRIVALAGSEARERFGAEASARAVRQVYDEVLGSARSAPHSPSPAAA